MRVKFIKTSDLGELEATANLLFIEGWERQSNVILLANGEFFMEFVKYTSHSDSGRGSPGYLRPPSEYSTALNQPEIATGATAEDPGYVIQS
jgi:hypothetical protein